MAGGLQCLEGFVPALARRGVDDLEAYLRADPSLLAQCSAALRVLQVNQRTLDLFAAPDQVTLVAQLGQIFRDDMHHSLVRVSWFSSGRGGWNIPMRA